MSLAHTFRLSFFITMGLSCLCLFYGEWDFYPWISVTFPLVVLFMVLAYRQEGEQCLSEKVANRIGTAIGIATILWVAVNLPRSDADLIAGGVPWPAALVPLLAPLLPILLMVKLFRPISFGDFWVFQTIALVNVTLSCILAGEVWFFLLLALFLASQLWCLALYFLYRQRVSGEWRVESGEKEKRAGTGARSGARAGARAREGSQTIPALALAPDLPTPHSPLSSRPLFGNAQQSDPGLVPWPLLGTRRAVIWFVPVLIIGLILFFLMPRFTDSQWEPISLAAGVPKAMKTGSGPIDLFREGDVVLSKETAFEVRAMNARGGPLALPPNPYWRVQVLELYENGQWKVANQSHLESKDKDALVFKTEPVPSADHVLDNQQFPDQPPGDMQEMPAYLCFDVDPDKIGAKSGGGRELGGAPLADPVRSPAEVGLFPELGHRLSRSPFFMYSSGFDRFQPTKVFGKNLHMSYGQVYSPAYSIGRIRASDNIGRYHRFLATLEAPSAITRFTRMLLDRTQVLKKANLEADAVDDLPPQEHARIARALCIHLANSGEFNYSLKQRLIVRTEDPTADFLINVKEGHCVRFASGLALMLRSLKIPVRVVRGFHGCAAQEQKGNYIVRQDHAHSWVEALVPGDAPNTWHWLQLDPTPGDEQTTQSVMPFLYRLWVNITNPQILWKSMIMEYNTERQAQAAERCQEFIEAVTADRQRSLFADIWETFGWPILFLGATLTWLTLRWGWPWIRSWSGGRGKGKFAKALPRLDFQARLLKMLSRQWRIQPRVGQTPLEFARQAEGVILEQSRTWPSLATFVDLPLRATNLLYRVRYAGEGEISEECRVVELQVSQLESTLRRLRTAGR